MTGRLSWVLALAVLIVSGALMALIGADNSSEQSPVPVPSSAESARADAMRSQLPGGDRVPAIIRNARPVPTVVVRSAVIGRPAIVTVRVIVVVASILGGRDREPRSDDAGGTGASRDGLTLLTA